MEVVVGIGQAGECVGARWSHFDYKQGRVEIASSSLGNETITMLFFDFNNSRKHLRSFL